MRQFINPNLLISSIHSMGYLVIISPLLLRSFPSAIYLLLGALVIQLINYITYRQARKRELSVEDNMLIVGAAGNRVWPTHKSRWLSFLMLDVIDYEQTSYEPPKKRRLNSYFYTRKDWRLLNATCMVNKLQERVETHL